MLPLKISELFSLPLSDTGRYPVSPHYSGRGGAISTTNNMAYELTTLSGPDDGSHEYEVIGRGKAGSEGTNEMPTDITPHPVRQTIPTPQDVDCA